jgi:L-fuconolactonase
MSDTQTLTDSILEPELPIVDAHHHLWEWPAALLRHLPRAEHDFDKALRRTPRYLLDELLADVNTGHNICATVFVQCAAMYAADAPKAFAVVGETEFANGIAAMCASGLYGKIRACAGIVSHVDLTLGPIVSDVLHMQVRAGGGRFKGIRQIGAHDSDPKVLGPLAITPASLYAAAAFRAGYARLADFDLSFDAWVLEPQLPELIALARDFPDVPVILDHMGTPLGVASYEGRRAERFPIWCNNIRELAALPNVSVKLSGLAMPFCNFPSFSPDLHTTQSRQLASAWAPYIETCVQAFGVNRCMFASNFPIDGNVCGYATMWNAFKWMVKDYSADEKTALFSGTARRIYRLAT